MGLTDNWHLPWVLLTTDEVPDCPLSSTKPFFKALNIIELYCSTLFFFSGVRQCDQMCVFMGNLSSKTLKSHISSMTYDLKFLPLWERASIRCLLMRVLHKSNCKFLPRWFRYGLSWSFLLLYLPTFSESNAWDFHPVMTGISGNVLASSDDFRRLSEDFRTLPKMSADVPKAFVLPGWDRCL